MLAMPLAVPPVRAIRMPVMPEYANQSDAALMSRLEALDCSTAWHCACAAAH